MRGKRCFRLWVVTREREFDSGGGNEEESGPTTVWSTRFSGNWKVIRAEFTAPRQRTCLADYSGPTGTERSLAGVTG